jgi:hypothetical protein
MQAIRRNLSTMDETRFHVTLTNLEEQLPDKMKSAYRQSAQSLRVCIRVCVCVFVCEWQQATK